MIDELKEKVEAIKKKEKELDIAMQTISIVKPLFNEVSLSLQEKVQLNALSIIQETAKEVGEGIKNKLNYSEIVKKLEKLELQGKDKEIVQELQSLILRIEGLSKNTVYNHENLVQVFNTSLEKIVNIMVKGNEIPSTTEYKRTKDKITQVIERYEGYTLTHKWIYDSSGNLIKVTTTKDEIA